MVSYAWGGYSNGKIPLSALAQIPGTDQYIKRELLPAVVALRAAFKAEFDKELAITEAYRSYDTQVLLYDGWVRRLPGYNLASPPGNSLHGWGISIDFGSRVNAYGTEEKKWMDANAPAYGFVPSGNSFSPREAWHFDGTGTITAALAATHIDLLAQEEEDDIMGILYQADPTKAMTGLAVPGWCYLRGEDGIFRALSTLETNDFKQQHPQAYDRRVIFAPSDLDDQFNRTGLYEYTGNDKTGPKALTGRIIGRSADLNNENGSNARHWPRTEAGSWPAPVKR